MERFTDAIARTTTAALLAATLVLSGCYSQSNWTPTVDPYRDPDPQRVSGDLYECRQLAQNASGGTGRETLTGGAVGGLLGAAAGAAIGAATGNPGKGAAIGAATGGIGGGAYKGLSAESRYQDAYRMCMQNRGHAVVN
jgi:outer membrane lipoprotein SlyB